MPKVEKDKLFEFDLPIMIPSLKRYAKAKKGTEILMIEKCIDDLHKHYDKPNVYILGQEYTEEERKHLTDKYIDCNVTFEWREKRLGIVKTFNELKEWGGALNDFYVHYDDDVKMSQMFDDNSTLNAMKHVMMTRPDRIGSVTVPSISIHHFSKGAKGLIKLHSNPAQMVLLNAKASKDCVYDAQFENFRSDTDFTMQVASKGYIPLMITRYFSFMHTVPMSTIEYNEKGGRKFRLLDNVTETKGSIGGVRKMETKKIEYDAFQAKWPKVITFKTYKQQVLKRSIVHLSQFTDHELIELEEKFDYDLIRNYHPEYYGDDTPEIKRVFG